MNQEEFTSLICRLRQQGTDDSGVEVKECANRLGASVWESISAFANTNGGVLLLGLSEKEGFAPAAGFNVEKAVRQLVSGMGDAGSGALLTNPPSYSIERHLLDDQPVLAVAIRPLDLPLRPCFITDRGIQAGSYKRIDDRDVRLSPTEIYSMLNVFRPSSADMAAVLGAPREDLDRRIIDAIMADLERAGSKALRGADGDDARLRRLNIITASGDVTMAGMLACGFYPQQYFPRLVVDVAAHAGAQKAQPGAPRFLDRTVCEGPLGEVIEDAVHAVSKNLLRRSVVSGVGRIDELEIPETVLREAIANAVVHREYSAQFLGQAVQVDIFVDRVEVTSPGGLWGGKTLENLDDGQSRCRNAALMHLASRITLKSESGRPAEGGGTGVRMMMDEMSARGLPLPEFVAEPDCFVVVFRLVPGTRPDVGSGVCTGARAGRSAGRRGGRISKGDVLEAIEGASGAAPMGVREISEALGASTAAVRNHLRELLREGLIVPTAPSTSKNRKYLKS